MKRENLYIRYPSKKDGTYDFIKKLGGSPEEIARIAGLAQPDTHTKIRYIPWANLCHFFELTAQSLNDPYFGLKWAMNIPEDLRNLGPILYLGTTATNLRHFVNILTSYLKVYTNGFVFSHHEDVEVNTTIYEIAIHPLSPPCRQYCEHIMAMIAEMTRRYALDVELKEVTFQYSEPEDMSWYEKAFQCPVYFNADRNALVTDRGYLETDKMQWTRKVVKPLFNTYLKWNIDKNPYASNTVSQMIIETLPAIMGANKSDLTVVAKALDMHPKKLQRLLAEEGTSYSDLLDNVRSNLAVRLLVETDIGIDRIAKTLDYTTDRAFTAAAKRWFGTTPTHYRKYQSQ